VSNTVPVVEPLHVRVTREAFSDFYHLYVDDIIEELEIEELRKWFDVRGANMYEIEKALDYVWNFREAHITIRQPVRPKTVIDAFTPDLT
jgi:hypothetical protein